MSDQRLRIDVCPTNRKITWFGHLKMHLWNFILPPHIRLSINEARMSELKVDIKV